MSSFHTNFFGAVNLTRSLLPHLREKRSGSLVYMGSISAYVGEFAAVPYISSKGALESKLALLPFYSTLWSPIIDSLVTSSGFIDCVSKDASLFNIKCTLAILGEYRTHVFSETNVSWGPSSIKDYETLNAAIKEGLRKADHVQPGDPEKAAERLVDAVKGQGDAAGRAMPTRLILGPDAFQGIRQKSRMLLKLCDEWEQFGSHTNYDGAEGGKYLGSVS